MVKPAEIVTPRTARGQAFYELPLSERMRTFLRIEFLYRQMLYSAETDSRWATRATISTLLELLAILLRGDVRGEVHKELDYHISALQRFQSQPGVDNRRLESLIRNLVESRNEVSAIGTQYLQPLKDSEFLRAIQHRNSIPGGTCEFDLPEYNHWLRQPYERRQQDLDRWIGAVRPLCDAVVEILWLIRESAEPIGKTAINGMYQHSMRKDAHGRLLRVILGSGSELYPEISGSQHRFTVRFLEWSTIESRAVQTGHDVAFQLAIC
ncbi:MAG TPA: cell division protein ZapD [Woeseiaceae bacterium]|nr:cell division protein ZapD [Woeseiaceae bacterium]